MSKHKKKQKPARRTPAGAAAVAGTAQLPQRYKSACQLAIAGQRKDARRLYVELEAMIPEPKLRAVVRNDLAVLDAMANDFEAARQGLDAALVLDAACDPARLNLALLLTSPYRVLLGASTGAQKREPLKGADGGTCGNANDELSVIVPGETVLGDSNALRRAPHPGPLPVIGAREQDSLGSEARTRAETPGACPPGPATAIRVAVLSFLFNWPSTGGGNIHTLELVQFLGRAGYEVRHFYACFSGWGIGNVQSNVPIATEALVFDETNWNLTSIQARFRAAVDRFAPDYVVVADSWNMKPILAEAVAGYPYFLRIQAQECICPLNNLRLLAEDAATVVQCPRSQLATPDVCRKCVLERGHHSGTLHQCERALAGVGRGEYHERLRRTIQDAEAVLVLNPLVGAMLEPYARRVCVVPWGMDTTRFPWPPPDEPGSESKRDLAVLFMAAVAGEFIKGAHVAHEACRLLRQSRSDFELVVTSDPPGQIDGFTRSVGWCSQADLPEHYRSADICLVPTIAQDGLSRTSVEAMASGIPVVASRIGGLPFTVADGVTGLLADPGDPADLARKIAKLLDDPPLRRQMGLAGRRRFEQDFTWETVIERHYRPLLSQRAHKQGSSAP